MRHLLLLACLTTPAAAQAGDSLVLETPETRLVVHAAEWATLPRDTMRVAFHGQPSQLYAGVPLPALLQLVGVRDRFAPGSRVVAPRRARGGRRLPGRARPHRP